MVNALIFAGGTGQRMNSGAKPKQFLELHGKPILIYTIEYFESHPEVDGIMIVCLKEWIPELKRQLRLYQIKKVRGVISGGNTGHESIYIGLKALDKFCQNDDIVLIHDGVRPLISQELITRNIQVTKEKGTAITVAPAVESIVCIKDGDKISSVPDRNQMFIAKAPQTFQFRFILDVYEKADEKGILAIDSAHLLSILGHEMYTVNSTPYNIKITTPSDYFVFRALYEAKENSQIFGILNS